MGIVTIILSRHILIGRMVLAVIMLSIPVYLSVKKEKIAIKLLLYSTHLNFHLDYTGTQRRKKTEVKMIRKHLKAEEIKASSFELFTFMAYRKVIERSLKHSVEVLPGDDGDLQLTSEDDLLSIVSLNYEGVTKTEVSVSGGFLSFEFKSAPGFQYPWNVYVEISPPKTFQLKYDRDKYLIRWPEANSESRSVHNLHMVDTMVTTEFVRAGNIWVQANDNKLKLKIRDPGRLNKEIFRELEITDILNTLRFASEGAFKSTLMDSSYYKIDEDPVYLHDGGRIKEFNADSLKLDELKLIDGSISAKISGYFSKLKIKKDRLSKSEDVVPSKLSHLSTAFSPWVRGILAGTYVLLFVTVLLGAKAYPILIELIKVIIRRV